MVCEIKVMELNRCDEREQVKNAPGLRCFEIDRHEDMC